MGLDHYWEQESTDIIVVFDHGCITINTLDFLGLKCCKFFLHLDNCSAHKDVATPKFKWKSWVPPASALPSLVQIVVFQTLKSFSSSYPPPEAYQFLHFTACHPPENPQHGANSKSYYTSTGTGFPILTAFQSSSTWVLPAKEKVKSMGNRQAMEESAPHAKT